MGIGSWLSFIDRGRHAIYIYPGKRPIEEQGWLLQSGGGLTSWGRCPDMKVGVIAVVIGSWLSFIDRSCE
ncbi:hypothetical protein GJAV_G00214870 [Gymnothorax javanicus]|nr:hypothetical protein GJAV_G00214870 [Gymnothorax javanicus]